jgi:hypothetical protein
MGMSKVMHQMSAKAERAGVAPGEALRDPASDETQGTTHDTEGTGLRSLTGQHSCRQPDTVIVVKQVVGIAKAEMAASNVLWLT